MRARVDPTRCQGYGVCVELAPKHFVYDDWGFVQSVRIEVVDDEQRTAVNRAIDQCPIKAIRWLDEGQPGTSAGGQATANSI